MFFLQDGRVIFSLQGLERNGGGDGTRTRGLCRDSLGINVLSATYVLNGGCQVAEKDCKNLSLWVNLWVRILASTSAPFLSTRRSPVQQAPKNSFRKCHRRLAIFCVCSLRVEIVPF